MKKFNLSIGWFSFLFSVTISFVFAVIAHFYMQESIKNTKLHEEHLIGCYANTITNKNQSLDEFKKLRFGTLESFIYKIALIDINHKLLYTTFDKNPTYYNMKKITYYEDGSVYYNNIVDFADIKEVKIIVQKKLDFSNIKKKSIIIISATFIFLMCCSLFLYFHIREIYASTNKKIDAFFKDAIHEIRTPLGVIQINLDFLENTIENSMPLKRAQGGLRNLTSVYESLEYSIKNKKVKYKKENINISRFIKNRIDFFMVLADIKNINIDYLIEEDIFIYISRIELQRLIDNNISNAIKYSDEKSKIEILLTKKENDLFMKFSNYGKQIEDTGKIFKRYFRGDEIKGGFGLGLSIVAYICNIYNICIDVTSNKEGYTTFTYKLTNILRV